MNNLYIKKCGSNFVQFKASSFSELVLELTKLEGFLMAKNPCVIGADYWGIVDCESNENTIVKLSEGLQGRTLNVNWKTVTKNFPRLIQLLDEFNLHYYIAKNYIGNWGVHRHVYSEFSKMNLCLLVKGNNNGTVNFHAIDNEHDFEPMSEDHNFDLHNQEFSADTIVESVNIKDGQAYSFNTSKWHSHIVKDTKAEIFLLQFRGCSSAFDIVKTMGIH